MDNGSSTDILVWQCFNKMGLTEKALQKSQYPLIGVGAYQRHLAMTPADANLGRQYFMNHE